MTMPPYKPNKRSTPFIFLAVRAVLFCGAIVLLFLIVDAIVDATRIPSLRVGGAIDALSSKKQLIEKIESLEESLGRLTIAQEESEMLRRENEALKKELGRESVLGSGILARVLTLPQRNLYDTIIIDAGHEEGVVSGSNVFAFDDIVLGTVTEVGDHRSTVQLFSAPGRQTTGTAEGSDIAITLIGRGSGEYEVRMPRDLQFSVGELISYQSMAPAVLAKIEHVATDPRDPFQRLLAKAPVNLNALKFVIVK